MKQLILFLLLFCSISFGQSGKSVLTQAQKDSIGTIINDSSDVLRSEWVNDISDSLSAKIGWVSVKDFGAVGNGTTNDSSAFAQAVATGKNIKVPAGSYLTGKITLTSYYQKIEGEGKVKTTLIPTTYTDTMIVLGGYGHSVSNLYFTTSNVSKPNLGCIIKIKLGVGQCSFEDLWMRFIVSGENVSGILFAEANNTNWINRVSLYGLYSGIELAQYQHNTVITNSRISDCRYGVWFRASEQTSFGFNIRATTFDVCDTSLYFQNEVDLRLKDVHFESANRDIVLTNRPTWLAIDGIYSGRGSADYAIGLPSLTGVYVHISNGYFTTYSQDPPIENYALNEANILIENVSVNNGVAEVRTAYKNYGETEMFGGTQIGSNAPVIDSVQVSSDSLFIYIDGERFKVNK